MGWHGLSGKGSRVAVVGTGVTGLETARVLLSLGTEVTLYDTRDESAIPEDALRKARGMGCVTRLGTHDGLGDHSVVVTSPGVPIGSPYFAPARERGVEVISEIEAAFRLWPDILLIGVTGTNGKSTTTALTGEMLAQTGLPVRVCGNIGAPLIGAVADVPAAERGRTWFVAEVSSFQLEATEWFRPHAAALLNVTDDHRDRHPTLQSYVSAKARLFRRQTPADVAVLNAADEACRSLLPQLRSRVWWFSADGAVTDGAYVADGCVVHAVGGATTELCQVDGVRLVGRHNLENVLAAIALSMAAGATAGGVQRALRVFEPAAHTFRRVGSAGGVVIINDSKGTNVGATVRGLQGLDKPVVLIAGGSSKGADYAPLGECLAQRARALVVLGATAREIADAARRAGLTCIREAHDMDEAVRIGFELAQPGDYLVLSPACASFDLFENYKARGLAFERAAAGLPGFEPVNAGHD